MKSASGNVVLALDLPPNPPTVVQDAQARFDRYADEAARLQIERRELRQELEAAKKADAADYAKALAKDFDAKPTSTNVDAVQAKQLEIETKLPIILAEADRAGDDLVRSVGQALEEGWREELQEAADAGTSRVEAAIDEIDAALEAFMRTKNAALWAAAFTVQDGLQPGWHRAKDVAYRPDRPAYVLVPSNANAPGHNGLKLMLASGVISGLRQITKEPEAPKVVTDAPGLVVG